MSFFKTHQKTKTFVLPFIVALLAIVYLFAEYKRLGDFSVFWDAGTLLKSKRNIYLYNELNSFKYYYSPAFALFLSVFSAVNPLIIAVIWKALNIGFLVRIWLIIQQRYLDFNLLELKYRRLLEVLMFLGCITFITATFHVVQMSVFLLYAMFEGVDLIIHKKRPILGALLISIAINIKVMPIVVIPYLFFRKEWLSVIWIKVFFIALILVPSLFIGHDYNKFLHSEWWKSINPINEEHILDVNERGFHSLSALITSLFTDNLGNASNLQYKRNILNLNVETVTIILNIIRLSLVGYTLKILGASFFKKSKSKLHVFYELSYILLITPLIFPHQQIYGFLLIFPALTYVLYNLFIDFSLTKKVGVKMVLLLVALILSNSTTIFGFIRYDLAHFKVTTYGVLLILGLFISYPVADLRGRLKI